MRHFQNFPYILLMNGQEAAGFRFLMLPGAGEKGSPGLNYGLVTLAHGLTYDRSLLRWASDWRSGAPWLCYALFWLRPRKDLELCQLDERGQICASHKLQQCRVRALTIGPIQPNGGVIVEKITFRQHGRQFVTVRRVAGGSAAGQALARGLFTGFLPGAKDE